MASYVAMAGFKATTVNGDRPQRLREEALRAFKGNDTPIMVATDVMARGLDIKDLDYVINMDLPQDVITYVHRIGRTGRLRQGRAISLFDPADNYNLTLAATLTEVSFILFYINFFSSWKVMETKFLNSSRMRNLMMNQLRMMDLEKVEDLVPLQADSVVEQMQQVVKDLELLLVVLVPEVDSVVVKASERPLKNPRKILVLFNKLNWILTIRYAILLYIVNYQYILL